MEKKGSGIKDEPNPGERHSQLSFNTSQSVGERMSRFSDSILPSFLNIRITPKVIEFVDAFEGKQFSVEISIQNVGKNPTKIKIGEPNSFIFQLKKPSRRAIILASGSSIHSTVSYTYHNDDLVKRSEIPVQINGNMIYYPIIVKTARPEIEVEPQKLHFEVINLGATVKSMTLTITNNGGIRTKFAIDCGKNPLSLVVHPMRGTIKAKSATEIQVEMMGLIEGEFYQEIWLYTTGAPIRIPVFVEVVWPRLKIVQPKGTEEITLIDFRPTFVGTQRFFSFTLNNFSAECNTYVILAEVNGEQEILKTAKNTIEAFDMFSFGSEEGYLQSFENRMLSVFFCPKPLVKSKGWHEEIKANQIRREYVIFIRIMGVHCLEWKELAKIEINPINHYPGIEHTNSFEYKKGSVNTPEGLPVIFPTRSTHPREEFLRVCLHGQAVEPDIEIQPLSLDFGDLIVGDKSDKVLKITNNSLVSVKCSLFKVANVETTPKEFWLKNEKSQEFLLSLTPQSPGVFKTKMKVQIFAKSDVAFSSTKKLEMIAVYNVNLVYTAKEVTSVPKPVLGLGITPLITDNVGLNKDLILFKDVEKLPFAAVLGLKQGLKPTWMQQEKDQINNVENAIVALPNDRPRYFVSWPNNKICRTIFSGLFRYSPPEDLSYTLSPEERRKKEQHSAIWADYITLLRKLRLEKTQLKNLKNYLEYDLSCKNSQNLRKFEIDLEPYNKNLLGFKMNPKEREHVLQNALVPLSALYLIRISVHPKLINFSLVAVNTKAQELVTICNMNPFPISLKFTSGNFAVSVMDESTFTVQPMSTKSVYVLFETSVLGRYFGFLDYLINGCHEFKISIFAFVTPKILVIEDTSLELGNYEPKDAFQPWSFFLPVENPTQAPIRYRWGFQSDSLFTAKIMTGEIPPRSKLLTEILFELSPKRVFYSEIKFTSENGTINLIKLTKPIKKVSVRFVEKNVNMRDIPLNLPTKAKAIIQNFCYHDVLFELLTVNPIPGITIEPKRGIVKRRSVFSLEINVKIPVIIKFSFEIDVIVHFTNRITATVTGKVVPPNIRMRPSEVNLRKICVQSFDIFTFCVENVGTTPAEVKLDLDFYPEFKIVNNKSKLYLLPKKSSKIMIRFGPKIAARYAFYLPIILNNILGPPSAQARETEFISFYISEYEELYQNYGTVSPSKNPELNLPMVCINSNTTPGLLKISPLNLEFRNENNYCSPSQNVEILNVFRGDVTFCIRNDDLGENNSPFNLTPVCCHDIVEHRLKSIKVQLKKNEKLILKATFEPKKPGSYSIEIPVFVRGYNEGFVYNYIRLSGHLKPPIIYTNVSEIHFSSVPLGVCSETTLMVTAENYHSTDIIRCRICNWNEDETEGKQRCITTEWLKEPQITPRNMSNVFYLRVKFESFFPVALRSYILLLDSSGKHSSVLLTAISDNSVVTNHAFLTLRSSKYKIIRDMPFEKSKLDESMLKYPIKKSDLKSIEKDNKSKSKGYTAFPYYEAEQSPSVSIMNMISNRPSFQIYKGPTLVIQTTKSMTRLSELHFVNIYKNLQFIDEDAKSIYSCSLKNSVVSNLSLESQTSTSRHPKMTFSTNEPGSIQPHEEPNSEEYFLKTRDYVERWMFEVVMRCGQYFSIPQSFQHVRKVKPPPKKKSAEKPSEGPGTKDFLDFLNEVVGSDQNLPERPVTNQNDSKNINSLTMYFSDLLEYLRTKGCLLPRIRPEYLLEYEFYTEFVQSQEQYVEFFSWKDNSYHDLKKGNSSKTTLDQSNIKIVSEKEPVPKENSSMFFARDSWKKLLFEELSLGTQMETGEATEGNLEAETSKYHLELAADSALYHFEHEVEVLDQQTFEIISTQSWLDLIIQIFKVFVLDKIRQKSTIPEVSLIQMNDKLPSEKTNLRCVQNYGEKTSESLYLGPEKFGSNIYSCQEKILLDWLNDHIQVQKGNLWESTDEIFFQQKVLNNFDTDLSDSVALLSVTASHCPYIVSTHLKDVFLQPDTPNKKQHNAGKLIEAWRILEIGFTLETADIVTPNPVFMMMLVTHLYEVLPEFYPHSLISLSAPLNSDVSKKIPVKNAYDKRMVLKPMFFGEHEGYFSINEPLIHLKSSQVTRIVLKYTAKKIEKVSAVLLLSGCTLSPNFAKSLAFYLDGEPSEIPECEKFSLSAPMYKVICSEITLNPPLPDLTTYEIWYTTKQPDYTDFPDVETLFTPWSDIWNRKLSRRLFLNKNKIEIQENVPTTLSVTIACFTYEIRYFWLLFRSKISDFIIQVEIKAKMAEEQTLNVFYSESWSPSATCLCSYQSTLIPGNCPLLTELKIPMKNEDLWTSLRTMFFKTLLPEEKSFWNKHFGMDIGLCLILWLLGPDEEEEVLQEFIQVLPTKVNYTLILESDSGYVTIPSSVEILDVRENADVVLPLHISNSAPEKFNFQLTMVAENTLEIRSLQVYVQPRESRNGDTSAQELKFVNFLCLPGRAEAEKPCKESKIKKSSKFSKSKIRHINLSS